MSCGFQICLHKCKRCRNTYDCGNLKRECLKKIWGPFKTHVEGVFLCEVRIPVVWLCKSGLFTQDDALMVPSISE